MEIALVGRGLDGRRRRAVIASLLGALALAAALLSAPSAWAESMRWRAKPPSADAPADADVAEARERFNKGVKLYEEEGSVEAALAEMQRAYDLAPNFKILYNIGQVARTLRDYALALHAYERYLSDGGDKVPRGRRDQVQKDIDELRTYVSAVTIRVNRLDARVFVDDMLVGRSPLVDPIMINAGRVKIRAEAEGRSDTALVVVPGGDKLTVQLELSGQTAETAPSTEPEPVPAPEPQPVDDSGGPEIGYAWIGYVVGGALATAAIVTGALALSNQNSLEEESFAGDTPPGDVADKQDAVRGLAIATDVLIGAAATAVIITTVIILARPKDQTNEAGDVRLTPLSTVPHPAGAAAGPASPAAERSVTTGAAVEVSF